MEAQFCFNLKIRKDPPRLGRGHETEGQVTIYCANLSNCIQKSCPEKSAGFWEFVAVSVRF